MYILPTDTLRSLSLSSFNSVHNVWCQHFQTTKAACHPSLPQLVRREPTPLPCALAPEKACVHHLQDVSEIVQKLQRGQQTKGTLFHSFPHMKYRGQQGVPNIHLLQDIVHWHWLGFSSTIWHSLISTICYLHPLICAAVTLLPISSFFSHSSLFRIPF